MKKLETERKLYQMVGGMLMTACEQIPEDDFNTLPSGGGNSPNWILGHLVTVNLMALGMLGQSNRLAVKLMPVYGPGSKPSDDPAVGLPKSELLDHFKQTSEQLVQQIDQATSETLGAAQPMPVFQDELPTNRDLLAHILTTHLGLHFGQLSAWRRGRGYDPLLQIG